jgi:hypothetical protein
MPKIPGPFEVSAVGNSALLGASVKFCVRKVCRVETYNTRTPAHK